MIGYKGDPWIMVNGKWTTKDDPAYAGAQLQNQLIQAELDSIQAEEQRKKDQGAASAQLASQFLNQWNKSLSEAKGYYNSAIADIDKAWGLVDKGMADTKEFDSIYNDVQSSLAKYREQFGGAKKDAISAYRQDLADRRQAINNLKGLATADYEGVSGRAKADVSAESDAARRAQEREMTGLGISPNAINYQNAMRKARVNEAISKVLAGNTARLGEKNRLVDANKTLSDAISQGYNASGTAGVAGDIAKTELDYLNTASGIKKDKIGAITSLAGTGGNLASAKSGIASGYSQSMSEPFGELYAGTLGSALSLSPSTVTDMGVSNLAPQNYTTGITLRNTPNLLTR